MIEATMIWNEPNNKSHWDPEIDPDWSLFAQMTIAAGKAIRQANADMPRVLAGIAPIDPAFIAHLAGKRVLDHVDAVGARLPS
jgi:beta-xylosidase